jgi:glucose/arabinose dehydrogenase
MLTRALTIVALTLMLVGPLAAQDAQPTPPPVRDAQGTPTQPPQPPSRTPAQLVNVRVDMTITDQRGDAAPLSKNITIVVADRESGRIRTEGRDVANRPVTLNVDSRAEIVREGRIRVFVTIEYRPQSETAGIMPITETLAAILDDGKPLVVSQSADPASDRKVRLELKATILR